MTYAQTGWFSNSRRLGRLEGENADVLLHLREVALVVIQTLQLPLRLAR